MARLVESGHRLSDVRGYTLGQALTLLESHARLERQRQRSTLILARAAQATAQGYKDTLAALEDADGE